MPASIQFPCPARCGRLTTGGKCAVCAEAHAEQRGTTAERGYGAEHKRLRIQCFERDQWKCVDCGWEPAAVRIYRDAGQQPLTEAILQDLRSAFHRNERHLHADHVQPIAVRPQLANSLQNLATRCSVCHAVKTAQEDGGFGNAFGAKTKRANRADSRVDVALDGVETAPVWMR